MALFPITKVSVGDNTEVGTPSIGNVANGIAPAGIHSLAVGNVLVGKILQFDFTVPNVAYPNRFVFGRNLLQSKIGNIDSLTVGAPAITNNAFGLRPKGIASPMMGVVTVGGVLNFDFIAQNTPTEPYFHFGKRIITKAGGIGGELGTPNIEQTISLRPTGIEPPTILMPAMGRWIDFPFKGIAVYLGRFNFGGSDVVTKATLGDVGQFGVTGITNTAFGVTTSSLASADVGKPIITHLSNKEEIVGTPSGVVIDFNFNQTSAPTNAKNIPFYFNTYNQAITPSIHTLVFGIPHIKNIAKALMVSGFDVNTFGAPVFGVYRGLIEPTGADTQSFGQAKILSNSQFIKTGNLSTLAFGETKIKNKRQFITPKGVLSQDFGQAWTSHFLRHIITQGNDHLALGKHRISYHTQFVRPESIEKSEKDFATNHQIGGTQIIAPFGVEMTQWLTRIIPENQTIGITKGINGEFGTPTIDNHTQYLSPRGFGNNDGSADTVRFGKLQVFNSTQYISQYFIPDSGLTPQIKDPSDDNSQSDFGKWTAIANRNKTIATFGADNSKFGYQQIDNKAVPVLPMPITSEMGKPMVAYRVRKLPIDGIEAPHFSYWHIIRNTAKVLYPQGFDNQGFGKPSIESNLQTIKQIFPFESDDVGTPMIADRVRFVSVEWRHSIVPPTLPLPTIENHTRYLAPQGFDGTDGFKRKFGRAELIERFNIIKAHGREHSIFGADVIIKNLTPEVRAFGHNSAEFGTPAIRNEWREVLPFGNQMSAVGTPIIKDRKQTIRVDGVNGNVFGWHFVKKGIAPPYSTQYIELRKFDNKGIEKDGFGIGYPSNQVPIANVRTNIIRPTGIQSQQFGKTSLTANSIRIDSGIFELSVGSPRVWIKQQYIKPKGLDYYINEDKMGKPQLSPYTIYAPSGENATGQARRNHGSHYERKPIDSLVFGRTIISNQHRAIFQYHHRGDMQVFGQASIGNKNQFIKTRGFRGGYFGWHIIPFVPQTVEQFSDKPHKTAFGTHTIGFIGEQQNRIRAGALVSMQFGNADVSHFHRAIYPHSFVATQMGRSNSNDKPFMWQGLRIGERVLGNYGGFDSTVFGATWVSNKIREVNTEGFDSFVSEADIKSFKGRLTVKRAIDGMPKKSKQPQAIGVVGIAPPVVPVSSIKNKIHYIRPDGNSEQFRKGAW